MSGSGDVLTADGSGDNVSVVGNNDTVTSSSPEAVTFTNGNSISGTVTGSGNDLKIELLGSHSEVTVANWFASPADQLRAIQAGGMTLDNGAVGQLVQAMATFTAANPGFDPTSASGATLAHNDPGVQTAIAAAWHS
jgi:hypothetical protein